MKQQMTCPKCGHAQDVSEQCISCEIYFEKYYQALEQQKRQAELQEEQEANAALSREKGRAALKEEAGALNIVAIGGAAIVAFVGAWLWMIIAVKFQYEFGLIAWIIGGAVGFAAAALGGRGLLSGVLCALLAVAAIVGGKYWTVESLRSEAMAQFAVLEDGLVDTDWYYDEVLEDARLYREIGQDTQSIRAFMVERGYTDAVDPAGVSLVEVQEFQEYSAPDLEWIAANNPSFDEWTEHGREDIEGISTWSLIKEDFGILSALFLLLGVSTAFKLGAGSED